MSGILLSRFFSIFEVGFFSEYVSVLGNINRRIGIQEKESTIAVRADIDALAMDEKTGLPFASKIKGRMHSCGHDAHTAMLLGVLCLLAEHRDSVGGAVFLCFQSAEEIGEGADEIVAYLEKEGGVDTALGLHVVPELFTGELSVEAGPRMAGGCGFRIDVEGKGGHGARPDCCRDPIRPLCDIVLQTSSIPSNVISALEPVVVNTARIAAGTARNVVPDAGFCEGTLRYFSYGMDKKLFDLIDKIAQNTAAAYGVNAAVSYTGNVPPVVNSKRYSHMAQQVLNAMESLNAKEMAPDCGSDNFGTFLNNYEGIYGFLGITHPGSKNAYPHHHNKFDLDEAALKYGCEFLFRYILEFLTD